MRCRTMDETSKMSDAEIAAREHGRLAGRDTATFAGMCPHPHSQIVLRKAWMDGFGVGRDQLVTRDGEERVAERSRDASGA